MKTPCAGAVLLLGLAGGLGGCGAEPPPTPQPSARDNLRGELGGDARPGFARADAPRRFAFPADHGPHPGFRSEWWYLTGNAEDAAGRRHGFQVTFFRIGLAPGEAQRRSAWATHEVWMAHLALTDAAAGAYRHAERFARGGALGLAGAQPDGARIWLEDWVLSRTPDGIWALRAEAGDFALDLRFTPDKAPVLHGEGGRSPKGPEPGNASYYYSIPRLATRGTLRIGDDTRAVRGSAWLDREWSTSALGDAHEGWDWFALQLDDGTDVMVYEIRRFDRARSAYAYAAVMRADGAVTRLGPDEFEIHVEGEWTSPRGGTYPARWRLALAPLGALEVVPILADQEFRGTVRYWEGAVDVRREGRRAGRGYVELAGYARDG